MSRVNILAAIIGGFGGALSVTVHRILAALLANTERFRTWEATKRSQKLIRQAERAERHRNYLEDSAAEEAYWKEQEAEEETYRAAEEAYWGEQDGR